MIAVRKILKNKVYDSDTAELIARYENNKSKDADEHYTEDLHRKKTGELFIHGKGGPKSPYADGEKVIPMTLEQAQYWGHNTLTVDAYKTIFEPLEGGSTPFIIRALRAKAKLTQQGFADKYGIPKRTIGNWEAGINEPPEYVVALLTRCVEHDYGKVE